MLGTAQNESLRKSLSEEFSFVNKDDKCEKFVKNEGIAFSWFVARIFQNQSWLDFDISIDGKAVGKWNNSVGTIKCRNSGSMIVSSRRSQVPVVSRRSICHGSTFQQEEERKRVQCVP